jgi:phosphoglycerate dehydrogenase-like enzyme
VNKRLPGRCIIGAAQLLQMKPGSMLVNIACGEVVDDAALA